MIKWNTDCKMNELHVFSPVGLASKVLYFVFTVFGEGDQMVEMLCLDRKFVWLKMAFTLKYSIEIH